MGDPGWLNFKIPERNIDNYNKTKLLSKYKNIKRKNWVRHPPPPPPPQN